MKITLTEKTYTVNDSAYTWKFIDGANGISIPWLHGNWLHFDKSKKWMVKSFHKALWMFLNEIEEKEKEENSTLISNEDFPFIPLSL